MPLSAPWYAGRTLAEHTPYFIESIFFILILDQEPGLICLYASDADIMLGQRRRS